VIDASSLLGSGIYVLWLRGRVVHVAWARNVLERVALHRQLAHQRAPKWMPTKPINFDRFEWQPCAEHEAEALLMRLNCDRAA
jgi:hypothetical protein